MCILSGAEDIHIFIVSSVLSVSPAICIRVFELKGVCKILSWRRVGVVVGEKQLSRNIMMTTLYITTLEGNRPKQC